MAGLFFELFLVSIIPLRDAYAYHTIYEDMGLNQCFLLWIRHDMEALVIGIPAELHLAVVFPPHTDVETAEPPDSGAISLHTISPSVVSKESVHNYGEV